MRVIELILPLRMRDQAGLAIMPSVPVSRCSTQLAFPPSVQAYPIHLIKFLK
jgi:hypothetical protein